MTRVLTTERMILREPTLADAGPLFATTTHPEVAEMLGRPPDPDEAAMRDRLARGLAMRGPRVPGYFVIERRELPGVIGTAGLAPGPDEEALELGFTLAHGSWGHGFATEAARACVELGLGLVPRLTARTLPGNVRALRVLEKLGFRARGQEGALLLLERGRT